MKKLIIATIFTLSIAASAFASTASKINSKASAHLEANYPSAKNVSWIVSDNFEKASFTSGDEKIEVYYDTYGNLIGSFKVMAYDKLPKSALDILTTEYTFPEYQLIDCIEFTDADNNKNYFVSYSINDERIVIEISANGIVTRI